MLLAKALGHAAIGGFIDLGENNAVWSLGEQVVLIRLMQWLIRMSLHCVYVTRWYYYWMA